MFFRLIYFLSIGLIVYLAQTSQASEIDNARTYLSHYGYMQKKDDRLSSISHENVFIEAVREFQEFANLEVTGQLDSKTINMMKMPRCGVKDKRNPVSVEKHSRFRRYVLHGSKWEDINLTYRISKYPTELGRSETDSEIRRAFEEWSRISPLNFTQKTIGRTDISIRFESGYHNDEDAFDGPGGTLAHARFPSGGGDVHFDDEEKWTVKFKGGTNLFRVAVHEFGHSLGLEHSRVPSAIMFPFYRGSSSNFKFDSDDIRGIQAIYGRKEIEEENRHKPAERPSIPKGSSDDDLCSNGKFDAIFDSLDGFIYILKGSSYWKLGERGLVPGYPKPISERWIGLPSNIDAAFSSLNEKTYFFKGSKYWRYNTEKGKEVDEGYPKEINEGFEGIPDDIDAVVWLHNLNQGFFFKGDKYWVFAADEKISVKNSYPKSITNFKGIPSDLDDVLKIGRKIFFFKNGLFYRIGEYSMEYQMSSITPPLQSVRVSFLDCFGLDDW